MKVYDKLIKTTYKNSWLTLHVFLPTEVLSLNSEHVKAETDLSINHKASWEPVKCAPKFKWAITTAYWKCPSL